MKRELIKNKLFLITAGLMLGVLMFLGPSIILSILVLLSIFSFIAKRPPKEKTALAQIIIIALVLRIIFFSIAMYIVYCSNSDVSKYVVNIVGHTIQVVRDLDREIKNGINIARYLRGEFGNIPIQQASHQGFGFLHSGAWMEGFLNYLFGVSVFNLLLFPLIDLWSVIIIYTLSKQLFDFRAASCSAFIYAIMPSVIVISCTNIRFTLSIFSFLLIALSLLTFAKSNNFKSLLLLIASVILFSIYREKASKPLLMIIPFALFMALGIRLRVKFILLSFFVAFFIVLYSKSSILQSKSLEMLQNIVASQRGFITEIEGETYSNYKIYDPIVYNKDIKEIPPSRLVKILPRGLLKGVTYFMLAPFPWDVTNTTRLYIYPQIIFWYFIIPTAIFGMIRSLFFKAKESLPIIILCGYFVVLLSLVLGNEGIAVRYRELVAPFFYIFASSILCRFVFPPESGSHKLR